MIDKVIESPRPEAVERLILAALHGFETELTVETCTAAELLSAATIVLNQLMLSALARSAPGARLHNQQIMYNTLMALACQVAPTAGLQ